METIRNFFSGGRPSTSTSPATKALREMGYSNEQAQVALQATDGDVQRAVALLLEQTEAAAPPPQTEFPRNQPARSAPAWRDDERAMQEALEASRRDAARARPSNPREAAMAAAEARMRSSGVAATPTPAATAIRPSAFAHSSPATRPGARSAGLQPAARAGSAAAGGSAAAADSRSTHVLSGLGGTAEELVQACASRLAGHASAVDTLIGSLSKVLEHPSDERYRKVNISNAAFQKHVASAPGGMEFMHAVGFIPMHGHLVLQSRDPALLWLGRSALEQTQRSRSYLAAKDSLDLERVLALSETEYSSEAARRRAAFAAKVPEEPPEGRAGNALLCFHLPEGAQVWRRFEACQTLEDLLNFARSLPGAPEQALRLDNVTMAPEVALDASAQLGLSLQSLDLWPTGHLRVRAG